MCTCVKNHKTCTSKYHMCICLLDPNLCKQTKNKSHYCICDKYSHKCRKDHKKYSKYKLCVSCINL